MIALHPEKMADQFRIGSLDLDDSGLSAPTPEVKQEREVAIFDLLEDNQFQLVPRKEQSPVAGPYHLDLSVKAGRLVLDVQTEDRDPITSFHLALSPFRQTIKDYFRICRAYFDAVKRLPAAQIEAIDHGRRAMHDEGGEPADAASRGERLKPISRQRVDCSRSFASFTSTVRHGECLRPPPLPFSFAATSMPFARQWPKVCSSSTAARRSSYSRSACAADQKSTVSRFAVCREIGIELERHKTKSFDDFEEWGDDLGSYDLVVALSPASLRRALEYTRYLSFEVEYWPTMDPVGLGENRDSKLESYRQVRDQIKARIVERFPPDA